MARGLPVRPARTDAPEDEDRPPITEDEPEPPCYPEEELPPPPEEEPPAPVPQIEPASAAPQLTWQELCEKTAPRLPPDLRVSLRDENRVKGALEGTTLTLYVTPGFLYTRFNKQEILTQFAQTAKELSGTELHVLLKELSQDQTPQTKRSLDELKGFKEVRFV